MKTRINVLLPLLMAFAVAGLTSCGLGGPDLTDQASVDKYLRKQIEKHIDPQSSVFEISLGSTADFSKSMDVAVVTFIAPGETEPKRFNITMGGNQDPRDTSNFISGSDRNKTAADGIKLADIDFSKIASNVDKAVEMAREMGEESEMEINFDGIGKYNIICNGNPQETIHKLSIESKSGSKTTTRSGRLATETSYYDIPFVADVNGNVEYDG